MSGGGEKTEKPTPKRLKEARDKGQVARTPDIGAWVAMLAATVIVPQTAKGLANVAVGLLLGIQAIVADPTPERAVAALSKGLRAGGMALVPLGVAAVLIAIVSSAAQGGVHVATKKLKPDFTSLDLFKGIKRLFGAMTFWEAGKVTVKTAALGFVLYLVVKGIVPRLAGSVSVPLASTLSITGAGVLTLVRISVMVGLVMAIADFMVKKRHTDKQQRMSKHEISQESKSSEGDPHVKGHRRSIQMAMSRNRMMSDIATADVVMVNPTHVAVALRYEPGKGAPRVVAKGKGAVATAIRERAEKERVPLVQDIALARALHAACDIGHEIPTDLYSAVAQVLAFVMSLRSRGVAAGTHVSPTARSAA